MTDRRWIVVAIVVNLVAFSGVAALVWALLTGRVHQ